MPKIDTERRLQIPWDLFSRLSIPLSTEVAICYENGRFVLLNSDAIVDHKIVAFRKLDSQRRIFLSNNLLSLLDANMEDELLVYSLNDHICIEKL